MGCGLKKSGCLADCSSKGGKPLLQWKCGDRVYAVSKFEWLYMRSSEGRLYD